MTAAQSPQTLGQIDPFSEDPPPEVLAEIQAGLDGIYGPRIDEDNEDGLGPEIDLTSDQARTAVLYYLSHNTQNDGWYKPVEEEPAEEDPEEEKLEYKRGIAAGMSVEIGLSDYIIKTAIHAGADWGLYEIETNETRGGVSITNVRVTQLGIDALEDLKVNQPEEIKAVDNFFVRGMRKDILLIRKEINSERKELGHEPCEFEEKLVAFKGLTALYAELARLRDMQTELLDQISSPLPWSRPR